jgi:hypothetical protein
MSKAQTLLQRARDVAATLEKASPVALASSLMSIGSLLEKADAEALLAARSSLDFSECDRIAHESSMLRVDVMSLAQARISPPDSVRWTSKGLRRAG